VAARRRVLGDEQQAAGVSADTRRCLDGLMGPDLGKVSVPSLLARSGHAHRTASTCASTTTESDAWFSAMLSARLGPSTLHRHKHAVAALSICSVVPRYQCQHKHYLHGNVFYTIICAV
jgi:hypothetical protein